MTNSAIQIGWKLSTQKVFNIGKKNIAFCDFKNKKDLTG